jgi:CrcB protein
VDPDVDVHVPAHRRERRWEPAVLGSIALGGIIGAEARYGMSVWLPHRPGQWPAATWLVNISGCLLIGVLMVVIAELTSPHRPHDSVFPWGTLTVNLVGSFLLGSLAAITSHVSPP